MAEHLQSKQPRLPAAFLRRLGLHQQCRYGLPRYTRNDSGRPSACRCLASMHMAALHVQSDGAYSAEPVSSSRICRQTPQAQNNMCIANCRPG